VGLYFFFVAILSVHRVHKSGSWSDMPFCLMPGASHHHKDVVGCTGAPFWPNNVYIIIRNILYQDKNPNASSIRFRNSLTFETLSGFINF
jgi:hypothetical protein